MPSVEVVGVYRFGAPEPCHLIELIVRGSDGQFDVGSITQLDDQAPRSDWQVLYAQKILDAFGERVVWDLSDGPGEDRFWQGDVRLVFFFHFLAFDGAARYAVRRRRAPEFHASSGAAREDRVRGAVAHITGARCAWPSLTTCGH
jgi:hypothetical protein